jgi:hypothetical protein
MTGTTDVITNIIGVGILVFGGIYVYAKFKKQDFRETLKELWEKLQNG